VGWLGVGTVVAGASRGKLEGLDGEWEVVIIGVVDEEPVVDGLLQTLGLVAFRHKWAAGSSSGALLNAGGLGQGLVMGLDLVHNDPPLAVDVDSPLGLDVGGLRGAQVGLLDDLLQAGDRVVGVGEHILVHLLDRVIVVLDSLLDLVGGILLILKAPGLGVALGALGRGVVCLLSRVVGSWVVWLRVVGGSMVGGVVWGHWVVWGHVVRGVVRSVGWLGVGHIRSRLRVVGWLRVAIRSRSIGLMVGGRRRGVPVGRWGRGVPVWGRGGSLGFSLSLSAGHHQ